MTNFYPQDNNKLLKKGRFLKSLGKGGYGKIDLYQFGDQKFIVKKLHSSKYENFTWYYKKLTSFNYSRLSPTEKRRNILLHEYSIGKIVDSPFIRKTLSIDLKKSCLFLEYIPGQDLFDFLNENINKEYFTIKEKLKIFKDIVQALDYLHSKYIAHLDLKLENIMIDPITHQISIIDLGKSFVWRRGTQQYKLLNIVSSYEYMAPEQFIETTTELQPDKIDIWSLGIIFYCLIYNKFPWSQAIPTEPKFCSHTRFLQIDQLSPSLFPNIKGESNELNENLYYLFKSTLCINPSDRINTKEILALIYASLL